MYVSKEDAKCTYALISNVLKDHTVFCVIFSTHVHKLCIQQTYVAIRTCSQ